MKRLILTLLFPSLLYAQSVTLDSEFISASVTELTIATGAVTTSNTQIVHTVDTESDDSTDDLDTITQGSDGDTFLILTNAADARNVVLKDGTGNLNLGRDITLDVAFEDWVILHFDTATWYLVAESDRLIDLDTIAELETQVGGDNIVIDTEIATQSLVKGLRTDLVASSVTAATDTGSPGPGAQTAQHIYITGGAANTAITLPALYAGASFKVENETTTNKKVYPASGDNIGAGASTEIDVPGGQILTVHSKDDADANSYLTVGYAVIDDGTNDVNLDLSGDRVFHDSDADGTKDAGELWVDGHKVATNSKAAAYTVGTDDDEESYGGIIYVTSAATITLPAVVDGMSVSVVTIGAIAVSVDANASDKIWLDGTALDDGDKITNLSTAGDLATLTYYSADGWYASTNSWTDGGP